MSTVTSPLPYAYGAPPGTGSLKLTPDDFQVEEILGFEPSGSGEHVFLHIEKRGENTDFVARQLARFANVPLRETGYAGLKDRHGVTRQWFSVKVPVKTELDFSVLESENLKILTTARNTRKLKKGAARGNRFIITIRQLNGERPALDTRLAQIAETGVPNYFGSQRFGHDGGNIEQALALFAGELGRIDPHKRGLYLSAARSEIFNRVLAARVEQGTWNQAVPGDVFMFPDSHSFFTADLTPDTLERIATRRIHASGPLWGAGDNPVSLEAAELENRITVQLDTLCRGLERHGLEMARRPLRLCPENLQWEYPEPGSLRLSFCLPSGAYATTLIRELIQEDTVSNTPENGGIEE